MGFLLTSSTRLLNFSGSRSSLYIKLRGYSLAQGPNVTNSKPNRQTFFLPMNELHSMLTPWLTIPTSRLWLTRNHSIISWSVGLLSNTNRSQSVHSVLPYLCLGAAIGSEKPKKGRARLTNPFLYSSNFLLPSITLRSSRQTRPVTRDVVVAIAGIILPAICLVLWRSAGLIP